MITWIGLAAEKPWPVLPSALIPRGDPLKIKSVEIDKRETALANTYPPLLLLLSKFTRTWWQLFLQRWITITDWSAAAGRGINLLLQSVSGNVAMLLNLNKRPRLRSARDKAEREERGWGGLFAVEGMQIACWKTRPRVWERRPSAFMCSRWPSFFSHKPLTTSDV